MTGTEGPFLDGGLLAFGAGRGSAGLTLVGSAGLEGGGPTGLAMGIFDATGLGAGEGSTGLTTLDGVTAGFAAGGGSTGLMTGAAAGGMGREAGRGLFPPLEAGLNSCCGPAGTGVEVEADAGLRT